MPGLRTCLAAAGLMVLLAPAARAQAVAFAPTIASFPNGVTLGATPVVSADRRYVRMTLNPQFTAIEGFDTFSVPAAVSGGNPGGGGMGLGGIAGLGGVAGIGGFAGMNGPMNGPGAAMGARFAGQPVSAGVPIQPDAGFAGSADFEDQPWPAATATKAARPRAGTVPKATTRRRRGRVARVEKPAVARQSARRP